MAKSISRYLADISSTSGVLDGTLSTAAQSNITSLGTLSSLTVSGSAAMTLTTAAQPNITSLGTLTTLTVDDITINGSTISDAADLTIDVGGDIILDAAGSDVRFHNAGTLHGRISTDSTGVWFISDISDKDIIFRGNDGGSMTTALTLDMSAAGAATFNAGATFAGNVGIGVTPKTWHSDWEALQIGERAAFFSQASTTTGIGENVYYNSGWKAIAAAAGSLYQLDSGNHHFYTMASVSADATSTPIERMRITSGGVVFVGGVTNTAGGYTFKVGGSDNQGELALFSNATASDIGSYDRTNSHYTPLMIHASSVTVTQGEMITPNGATEGYHIKQTGGTATPRVTNDGNNWTIIRPGASGADVAINNYANSANLVTFTDEGNVGINETTPTSYYSKTLQINGSGNTSAIKMTNTSTGNANNRGHDFASDGADIRLINREANGHVQLYTCAVTDSTILALDAMEDGQVRFPKQAAFEASGAGTWTSDLSTAWHGLIDTERHDANGDFDNTNGRFTAPHDGYYILTMSVYAQKNTTTASGGYVHPGIFINGAYTWMGGNTPYTIFGNAASNHSVTGYPDGITVTRTIHMSSGDYAEAKLYVNGTFRIYENYNYFAGGYLGG